MENKDVKTKTEDIKLDIEPIEFPGQARCLYVDTKKLEKEIGALFAPVFPDFSGCKIHINDGSGNKMPIINQTIAQGCLYVDLFFEESNRNAPDGEKNLTRRNESKGTGMLARINHTFGTRSPSVYSVTEWTLKLLKDFVPLNKNPRWAERVTETVYAANVPTGRERIMVQISGLSLDAIVMAMYGTEVTNENGIKTKYDYQIVPIRQTPNYQYQSMGFGVMNMEPKENYILQITQLDRRILNDLSESMGIGYQTPVEFTPYNR